MTKKYMLIAVLVGITQWAMGQAYEGTIKYDKKTQRAIVIDYPYPPEAVENAIIDKMAKLGYKVKEEKGLFNGDKGFLVFKSAYVTDISDEAMDYIVKVERKSRKASDESTMYMIVSKGDQNAIDKLGAEGITRGKSFLNNMQPDVESANLEIQIKDQTEVVMKAEKKLKDLQDDQATLEKKLRDNKKDQENTEKDIEAQKKALENLQSKRKAS